MPEILEAIFEDGHFKPVNNGCLPFSEGQVVTLTVDIRAQTPDDLLTLAGKVYEGLSDAEIDEVEQIALDRVSFFHDTPAS